MGLNILIGIFLGGLLVGAISFQMGLRHAGTKKKTEKMLISMWQQLERSERKLDAIVEFFGIHVKPRLAIDFEGLKTKFYKQHLISRKKKKRLELKQSLINVIWPHAEMTEEMKGDCCLPPDINIFDLKDVKKEKREGYNPPPKEPGPPERPTPPSPIRREHEKENAQTKSED